MACFKDLWRSDYKALAWPSLHLLRISVQDKLLDSRHLHFNPMEQPGDDDDDELDEDVVEEDQFGRIRYLELCQELQISPVSQILKFLESEEMHITHYGLGLNGTVALVGALELNTSLTALRLPHNNIPDEALRSLASCLVSNHNITELDLSGNRIGVQGSKALAELLDSRSCALRVLNCSHMHMSDREVVPLAAALENNQSVATLDLSNNDLGEKAGLALGNMLGINITLNELELSWNKLRTKGVAYIAEGLKPNLALQVLGLAWCGIQDAGAAALGGTFKINHGLVDVDFCGNGIGPEGAVALAAGIAQSTSLAAVALDNNDFREEGGRALLKALEMNRGIVICRVENTNISQELRIAADALLAPRMATQRALCCGDGGDAVCKVNLDPKWAWQRQRLRLYGAQDRALEQFFKKLQEEVAMKRHGRAKQLVVFFGTASIESKGGCGADAVLRACCKVGLQEGEKQNRSPLQAEGRHPPQAAQASVPWGSSPAADPSGSSPAADPSGSSPAADPSGSSPAADPSGSSPAADPSGSSPAADTSGSSSGNKRQPADIGSGLADERAWAWGMGLDPGAIQAVSAASGVWDEDGCLQCFIRSKLTRSQVQHDSGLIQARHNTQRWNENVKLELQHLAAATPAGTSLVTIQRHVAVTLATWDAVWEEYLHTKWVEQKMRLHGAQEKVLERYFKKLVVFFGNAGIGTWGGWGAKAVLQACRKMVERANSGKPTDRVPGKVVTVDEFRTSRVSSAMNSPQPCVEELDRSKPTRLEGWKPPAGQVQNRLLRSAWSKRCEAPVRGLMWCPRLHQATPGDLGKWVDRDCNAALNLQRIGEAPWRPLELCRWQHRGAGPAKGNEYPALGFKELQDRACKAQAQQPVAQWNACYPFFITPELHLSHTK
ncbi:hypothetical protein QJQ45_018553 [Haematococcus lacustris]|nr:hypothetical protein QJQ45_018553 [Haematococcus lacustris]